KQSVGLHASVVVGLLGRDILFHDPADGPNQVMLMGSFINRRTGAMGIKGHMFVRDPTTIGRLKYYPEKKELVLASKGETKKYPLPWPTGWWRVWDGSTWYYYLTDKGIAMSCKSPPSPPSNTQPPAKAKIHNTGTWRRTSSNTLKITWKQVVGAPKP